ncbi:prepilin peptidase [Egibacter rhizosphaerae]|uniref:Prepilin peptidase n=1 Tax=Egibacter rhizosphaerae TaxID=1670831 RepID=A0A411YK18_9ACTN|nr:A24 family peptidase [Egibacter rhizosphaerae]QBI21554.1 prepilin peptidase [Egibacter rhizosphaerae]
MTLPTVAVAVLLGLLAGSFANVAIVRVPEGGSVVRPRSACPGCDARIAPRDNVPVLSWLWLRGRCRSCAERIPVRYPLVEIGIGVLFGVVAWRVGLDPLLPAWLLFAWTLFVLAVIDLRVRRIPNRLTYPLTPVLLLLVVGGALLGGDPAGALRGVLGGVAAFAALLALALISPRGMGMGDVKLAGFIGVGLGPLGWGEVLLGVFGGFLVGGIVAIALLATGLRTRKDYVPFGPSLAAGALAALLVGEPIIDAYRAAVGM